jgi:hypothetical protein
MTKMRSDFEGKALDSVKLIHYLECLPLLLTVSNQSHDPPVEVRGNDQHEDHGSRRHAGFAL